MEVYFHLFTNAFKINYYLSLADKVRIMLTPRLIIQGNDYSVDMIQFSNKEDSIYILEPVKTQRT